MKKILNSGLIVTILISCGAGAGDISENLGNGYIYLVEGSSSRIVSDNTYKQGIYPNIEDYEYDDNFIIVKQEPNKKEIVNFFSSDLQTRYEFLLYMEDSLKKTKEIKRFMESEIWRDSMWHNEISSQVLPQNNIRDRDSFKSTILKIIDNDPFFKKMLSRKNNYYIINKKNNTVYGPLSINEYLITRDQLKISEKLSFKND